MARAGEDDHRETDAVATRSQQIQNLGRLHVWHLVVEEHQIWRAGTDARQRFGPADRDLDNIAGSPQQLCRELCSARLVVNDKQLRGHTAIPAGNLAGSAFVEETVRLP
jgi:hypothetical protein